MKNDRGVLPLQREKIKSIAVIGKPGAKLQVGALGSPRVQPAHTTELIDGLKDRTADKIKINYVVGSEDGEVIPTSAVTLTNDPNTHGFRAEYFRNMTLSGEPSLVRTDKEIDLQDRATPAPGIPRNQFSVRWTANLSVPETGSYVLVFTGNDGFRVFIDDKKIIDHWDHRSQSTGTNELKLAAGKNYALRVEFFQDGGGYMARLAWRRGGTPSFADAIAAAKSSDVAIVCVSTMGLEGEGNDRPSMDLPNDQAALIRAVAAANRHTIVVLNNGTPVTMSDWLKSVPALVEAWFPGQEGGAALADILFGNVNPSGKLPDTLAAERADYPDFANFPGTNHVERYAEDIYVGYRHFDKANVQPLFPFGYGLSYTTFKYSNLALSCAALEPDGSVTVRVDVTNTGKRAGEEIAQLYVHDVKPMIDRPVRELKGFSKIAFNPAKPKQSSSLSNRATSPTSTCPVINGKPTPATMKSRSAHPHATSN